MLTLADLSRGERGIIIKVRGRGSFRRRITEMGFIRGKEVTVLHNAPLRDPVEYRVMGYTVSLRRNEARLVEVVACAAEAEPLEHHRPRRQRRRWRHRKLLSSPLIPSSIITSDLPGDRCTEACCGPALIHKAENRAKIIDVALIGNPNCGKTTLFNLITGSREKVGNYSGVTVDIKTGHFAFEGYIINLVDLPGTYSLSAYSPEERLVREHLITKPPDVVVNVADASNLERNLYLTSQLIDMDMRTVVALNMYDILEKQGDVLDTENLGLLFGMPVVATSGATGHGLNNLFRQIIDSYEERDKTSRHIHIPYGTEIERSIRSLQAEIRKPRNVSLTDIVSSRFLSIKLLERDTAAREMIKDYCPNCSNIIEQSETEIRRIESLYDDEIESLITDARYGFISGALEETFVSGERPRETISERIDRFVTHRILGFPLFFMFMALTFYLTFALGQKPGELINLSFARLSRLVQSSMSPGLLNDLLARGILPGVGGILVFVPGIMILFFMIALLEDSGYMARASFIMDRVMHRMGLHGKSFIPLLMGFGCNVPAVMATRSLESRQDRLITMLIIPFMSCSARLPVYLLFITAFFPGHGALVLFSLYMTGILAAFASARLLRKTIVRGEDQPFVLELPPYRVPRARALFLHMWERVREYLRKIAGVILIASILIWALGTFPRTVNMSIDYNAEIERINKVYESTVSAAETDRVPGSDQEIQMVLSDLQQKRDQDVAELELRRDAEHLEKSYIGRIGSFVQPLLSPLGFDWKMSVSLVTGLAAKEIVVSTMAVLDRASDRGNPEAELAKNLREERYTSGPREGTPVHTTAGALAFLVFVLLYIPCAGVLSAIRRESGSWKWAVFAGIYTTSFAWVMAYLVRLAGDLL